MVVYCLRYTLLYIYIFLWIICDLFLNFRGFLKADKHFSTVNIKLDKFETAGTVHESFDVSTFTFTFLGGGKYQ